MWQNYFFYSTIKMKKKKTKTENTNKWVLIPPYQKLKQTDRQRNYVLFMWVNDGQFKNRRKCFVFQENKWTHMLSGKIEKVSVLWAASFTIFMILNILSRVFTPTLLFFLEATSIFWLWWVTYLLMVWCIICCSCLLSLIPWFFKYVCFGSGVPNTSISINR